METNYTDDRFEKDLGRHYMLDFMIAIIHMKKRDNKSGSKSKDY